MLRALLLALSRNRRLRRWFESNPWAVRRSRRFVAGLTLPEAVQAAGDLNRQGLAVSLDPLGEAVETPAAADAAVGDAQAALAAIRSAGLEADLSLKPSHFGIDLDPDAARARLQRLAATAADSNLRIWIDMESSAYTERTLALVEHLHVRGFPVATVLQAALRRTPDDLERLLRLQIPVRLVKGAYREPTDRAFARKSDVDAAFRALMFRLLRAGHGSRVVHAIGTHDPVMLAAAERELRRLDLDPSQMEFQLLYGIARDAQLRLRAAGWRVRVYVPYGPEWYPYFMRRLAERPANLLFLIKNLGNY